MKKTVNYVAAVMAVSALTGFTNVGAVGYEAGGGTVVANPPGNSSNYAIAIGSGAKAKMNSVAIGYSASTANEHGVALGILAQGTGDRAIAIGSNAKATLNNTISIGELSNATGYNALAMGRASEATASNAVAVGQASKANKQNSIAVGYSSVAESNDSISIGNSASTRSAGRSNTGNNIAIGTLASVDANSGIAIGRSSAVTGNRSIAVGQEAKATGNDSIAAGWNAQATGVNSLALGESSAASANASVALGSSSVADTVIDTATISIAGKNISVAGGDATGTVSVGSTRQKRTITNVAAGRVSSTSTDAVNGSQLQAVLDLAEANGSRIDGGITFHTNIGDPQTRKLGEGLSIIGADGNIYTKIDNGKVAIKLTPDVQLHSVTTSTVHVGGTTITDDGVSINNGPSMTTAGIDAGGQRITNVGTAVDPNDAMTKQQVDAIAQDLSDRIENSGIGVVNHRLNKMNKDIERVGAGAAALAGLHPLDFDPDDKFTVATGVGTYKGEQAVALGGFYRPNENTMFSLATTLGNNDNMVSLGASFKVGNTDNQRKDYKNYKTAPISTVYVLENQVNTLQAKNQNLEDENKNLRADVDDLKAKVVMLLEKVS